MSAATDIKAGRDALVYFHNEALKFPANYRLQFEELVSSLQSMAKGQFLEGFGFAISSSDFDDGQVKRAMQELARAGEGKLPTRWMSFFDALQGQIGNASFGTIANEVLKGTARDLVEDIQQVGNTAIETLKSTGELVKLLPYVAFAGIVGYIYFRVKK